MKKLTAIIFFLFAITIVVAQPSLKGKMMPDSNAIWVYRCANNYDPPKPPIINRHWFSVENSDTLISSLFYHKFYENFGSNKYYLGAYRNDTAQKITYIVPKDSVNEYLWFDFNANANDTISNVFFLNESQNNFEFIDSIVVIQIDTNQIFAAKTWSILALKYGSAPYDYKYSEGFGVAGLYRGIDYGCDLVCYQNNNYYYLGQQGNCLNVGIEEQNTQLKIELFPNPVTSNSTLTIDRIGDVKSVNIYDVFGRKVKEHHPANAIEINSAEFKSGIYFYSVVTAQKNYSGRFLVQ